ncbi:MAG: glycosyltransferase [Flavobacteriales bacterium]|nr:glycosyltransferase [Flavobacteriales bacterium]MCB9166624.1 glycosyltransferase [Flavobacteriales bacterium]
MEKSSSTLASYIVIMPAEAKGLLNPALDELARSVEETSAYSEIILLDDSGTDVFQEEVTTALAEHPALHYVRLNRSFGEEIASYAGMDQAIGDHVAVGVLGQDPLTELPRIMERCRSEERIIFGRATNKPTGGLLRRIGQRLFQRYAARALHVELDPRVTRLVAMPRSMVNTLLKLRDPSGYLSVQIGHAGVRPAYHDYVLDRPDLWLARQDLGSSIMRAVNVTAQNSVHPLRFVTYIGVIGLVFDLLYGLFILGIFLFMKDRAPGWVALSGQQAIYFFFICAFFVVISEYLGQIMINVKGRPLYFVADQRQGNAMDQMADKRNVVDE